MDLTQAGYVARELINKIGKNDFFINNNGPWRITCTDTIAESCEISLYEGNEFANAHQIMIKAADKFNIRQSVLNELIKSLDDSDPNWYYNLVTSIWVPFDFFRINRGHIHVNDIQDSIKKDLDTLTARGIIGTNAVAKNKE
jgi:hypothetical protein